MKECPLEFLDLQVKRLRVVGRLLGTGGEVGGTRYTFVCNHAPAIGKPAAQSLDYIVLRFKRIPKGLFGLFMAIVISRRLDSFGE